MKNETNNHSNAPKERGEQLKATVTELMKWREGEYASLQYETGLRYLSTYLEGDEHAESILSRSRIFWNWWKNHWTNRDAEFVALHDRITIRNLEIRRQLYEQYNEPRMLAACIHPNSVVLNETYADMITEVVKLETAAK